MAREAILVIKHGALGDLVLAFGPFAAIRKHHPEARIVLLTTAPYAEFCRASGLFDEVWIDERPRAWEIGKLLGLRQRLRRGGFTRIYDLQTSDRSSLLFRLFGRPKPEWSGIASGCSHPHANPHRDLMHTVERQAEQLAMAGIVATPQ
ncbi:MAG: glycosyltransferase family 9 protein, partial [Alphaproteobacteria bacterium]|nr:glycosyltransferase family 9 protein [Alphaproteobacteria bacterium]